jgi:hypothetical protein
LSSAASSLWAGVGPDNGGWHGIGGCAGSSDVGMVTFGVIMGGAGASLTGGNFWQGAATGLAVSGLNHLAHYYSAKHNFDREIDNYYGNKADEPVRGMSQKDIDNAIKNLPTLKRIYTKLVSKFKNLKVDYSSYFGADDGKTFFDTNSKSVSSITIFRSAGSISFRYMSQTILHEFGHAMSGYHGFFFSNFKKYGEYSDIPIAIDEIYAHKFAFYHGGVSYNTPYYKSQVNFLKGTSYKIDANSIKLPSF